MSLACYVRSYGSACALIISVILLPIGCTHPTPAALHALPISGMRVPAGTSKPDERLSAIARVQALEEYKQAEADCLHKQYAQAVRRLQRLTRTPGLSSETVRFLLLQRDLCLRDARLPLPAHTILPAVSPRPTEPVQAARPLAPDQADCGPRALLLVCRTLQIATTLPHLRHLAATTGEGTSMQGLATAARAVGLKAEGVQASREALSTLPMPAIAYVNGNHFIAVLSLQGAGEQGTATVHDPNQPQEQTISQERLLRLCSGYLLLLHL